MFHLQMCWRGTRLFTPKSSVVTSPPRVRPSQSSDPTLTSHLREKLHRCVLRFSVWETQPKKCHVGLDHRALWPMTHLTVVSRAQQGRPGRCLCASSVTPPNSTACPDTWTCRDLPSSTGVMAKASPLKTQGQARSQTSFQQLSN